MRFSTVEGGGAAGRAAGWGRGGYGCGCDAERMDSCRCTTVVRLTFLTYYRNAMTDYLVRADGFLVQIFVFVFVTLSSR